MPDSVTLSAYSSAFTAIFTAATLIFLAIYTSATLKLLKTAQEAYEEGLRPVLILVSVQDTGNGLRRANIKNTGMGVAINILRAGAFPQDSDDNVLAAGTDTTLLLPSKMEQNLLDLRYESLSGTKLCTVAAFDEDGGTFNSYVPDAENKNEGDFISLRSAVITRALSAKTKTLVAGQQLPPL